MIDRKARALIAPYFKSMAISVHKSRVSANQLTWTGLIIGTLSFPFLAVNVYAVALILLLVNRFIDGLDGAVARLENPDMASSSHDAGAYMDIVFDFIIYGGFVLFFAIGQAGTGLVAAVLLCAYLINATSFLCYSVMVAKRGVMTDISRQRSVFFLSGLAEGFETIVYMVLCCLFPMAFPVFTLLFALLCFVSAFARIKLSLDALSYRAEEE